VLHSVFDEIPYGFTHRDGVAAHRTGLLQIQVNLVMVGSRPHAQRLNGVPYDGANIDINEVRRLDALETD
jgi:hypothetical protein